MLPAVRSSVISVAGFVAFFAASVDGQTVLHQSGNKAEPIQWKDILGVRLESLPEIPGKHVMRPSPLTAFGVDAPIAQPLFGSSYLPQKKTTALGQVRRPVFPVARSLYDARLAVDIDGLIPTKVRSHKPSLIARNVRWVLVQPDTPSHVVSLRPAVSIDMTVLSRRISDHNRSLRSIKSRLQGKLHWHLGELESLANGIARIRQTRRVWILYYDTLDDRRRDSLSHVEPIEPILELLEQRIFETEVSANQDPATVSRFSQLETERRLSALNRRIRAWAKAEN